MQYRKKNSNHSNKQMNSSHQNLTKLFSTLLLLRQKQLTHMKKQTKNKMKKMHKAISKFFKQTLKNYAIMKTTLKKIWLISIFAVIATSCNVTRTITNESQYLQKGDTSVVIQTKTIETYNAEKK